MLNVAKTLAQKQLCCNQGWKNFCQSSPSADTVHTVHTVYHLHHAVPSSTVIHSTVHSVPSSVIASGASDLNSVHWHPDGFHTVRSSEDVVHGASSYGVSHPTATHFN
ncbi:unnamed protein product [Durusdinium trenchii]|uniref:Uncharacterized protein n=1 Tax=Durusdinium trenchii TaxID=1381693 RepID=A0ABP0KCU0_9DINO